ncbi:hypothetical protein JOC85_002390 [Bacillus mesophilus]|uniref:Uncharacterized protein n=1 Tax=Bacillus mesophilus TaxID=1808955 RepID=A0A6M0Q7C4_9BACI|nr:hypothetical protein [Bacillus mesophilus]MBM7661587.1 hypothetical protein [Bacillus mesophilus]NEY72256.1 hypothetical protein [Bacillus mesophilus]
MNHKELKETIIQLIDNIVSRIEQLNNYTSEQEVEIKERFIFLIEDLDILIKGVEHFDPEQNNGELFYILNRLVEILENNEFYLLQDVLSQELSPILLHWRGIIDNE